MYNFQATKKQVVVDTEKSIKDAGICEKYTDISHVVTEVTYGFNAHMIFEETINNVMLKKKIGGSLRVLVNSMPNFKIDAQASVKMTEEERKISESLHFKFHGDTIVSPPPSSFEDAVKVKLLNFIIKYATFY